MLLLLSLCGAAAAAYACGFCGVCIIFKHVIRERFGVAVCACARDFCNHHHYQVAQSATQQESKQDEHCFEILA